MPAAVVTGASSGIGRGTVGVLVDRGWDVFPSVRSGHDADGLRAEFGDRVTPLVFDITDADAVAAGAAEVSERLVGSTLGGLVNNAGVATGGPLAYVPVADFRHQLEINLVGILQVTQAFLPMLGMDRSLSGDPGRIVNVSSVGGKIGPPFLGGYSTSKHGLEGFSETLRRELMLFGIDVVIVGPGAIATPIWDKATEIDNSPYEGTEYEDAANRFRDFMVEDGRKGLPAEAVGEVVFQALTLEHPKTRYAVVRDPLVNWTIPRLMPRRFVDLVIANSLGWQVPARNALIGALAKRLGAPPA